jgi:NAD(P)-dependent dehydrogenase (short-subunit alcohol dehydrogenase family)
VRLTGRTVLITGAARGIGENVARAAAAKGATLALIGLEPTLLAAVCAALPGRGHVWFEADVTDQAQLDAAVAGTVAATGRIDVVVANAGIMPLGTVAATPVESLVRTVTVNLGGVIRTVSATLPYIRDAKGYYLLVSSISAFAAAPATAAYGAAKAGVEQFGNALRMELAPLGVGVGTAHPSRVDTDMTRDIYEEVPTIRLAMRGMGPAVSAQRCATAFVAGIEHRRSRIYVPRWIGVVQGLRTVLNAGAMQALMAKVAAGAAVRMDAEVGALGRSFGRHSVEAAKPAPMPDTES